MIPKNGKDKSQQYCSHGQLGHDPDHFGFACYLNLDHGTVLQNYLKMSKLTLVNKKNKKIKS